MDVDVEIALSPATSGVATAHGLQLVL